MKKSVNSLKTYKKEYKQIKILLVLAIALSAAHSHAGFFSQLLQNTVQTNQITATNVLGQATNSNGWNNLLNDQVTALKTNQLSQSLTTNQFTQLLASLKSTNTTSSLSTNNWSALAEKLNALFGNHFTVSNTNQWLQLANTALANKTQLASTNQIAQLISGGGSYTNSMTNQIAAPVINQALDWFKSKK